MSKQREEASGLGWREGGDVDRTVGDGRDVESREANRVTERPGEDSR